MSRAKSMICLLFPGEIGYYLHTLCTTLSHHTYVHMKAFIFELKCAKMKHITIQSESYTSLLTINWAFPLSTRKYLSYCCFKGIQLHSHSLKQCAKKICITAYRSN